MEPPTVRLLSFKSHMLTLNLPTGTLNHTPPFPSTVTVLRPMKVMDPRHRARAQVLRLSGPPQWCVPIPDLSRNRRSRGRRRGDQSYWVVLLGSVSTVPSTHALTDSEAGPARGRDCSECAAATLYAQPAGWPPSVGAPRPGPAQRGPTQLPVARARARDLGRLW